MPVNRNMPNIGPRLSIVDAKGKMLARLGGEAGPGLETGKFIAPHGLAVDSRGDIYVGEVSYTEFPKAFPDSQDSVAHALAAEAEKTELTSAPVFPIPAALQRYGSKFGIRPKSDVRI